MSANRNQKSRSSSVARRSASPIGLKSTAPIGQAGASKYFSSFG